MRIMVSASEADSISLTPVSLYAARIYTPKQTGNSHV